jgi:ABC-2 type transport system permease protein
VNLGALQSFAERGIPGLDYRAFQLPTAIVFAVTGVSRAPALVTDIQSGYFDRMLMTPISRLAILLGLMIADLVQVVLLSLPVILLGFLVGVRFETGLPGSSFLSCWRACGGWRSPASPTPSPSRPGHPAPSGPASSSSFRSPSSPRPPCRSRRRPAGWPPSPAGTR